MSWGPVSLASASDSFRRTPRSMGSSHDQLHVTHVFRSETLLKGSLGKDAKDSDVHGLLHPRRLAGFLPPITIQKR